MDLYCVSKSHGVFILKMETGKMCGMSASNYHEKLRSSVVFVGHIAVHYPRCLPILPLD